MNHPTIEKIIRPTTVVKHASELFELKSNIIQSNSRRARVVAIRDLCFKICKDHLFMSDREIAVSFSKERSSVTVALKRIEKNLETRKQYRLMFQELERSLEL